MSSASPVFGASGAIMNCLIYRRKPYSVSTGSRLISEWDELRLHAFELRNAAQRGQRVGQKPPA